MAPGVNCQRIAVQHMCCAVLALSHALSLCVSLIQKIAIIGNVNISLGALH